MTTDRTFTPALGKKWLTPLCDLAIAVLTREGKWGRRFVQQIGPLNNDRIIDVGCGTGSLVILLKLHAPDAHITGIDPDPAVLTPAKIKSGKSAVEISWRDGFWRTGRATAPRHKIVSSLVLHQTSLDVMQRILTSMHHLLKPGGELHIANYGLQRSRIMCFLFRRTVQLIDGGEDTQPNADGALPELIKSAGFVDVRQNGETSGLDAGFVSCAARCAGWVFRCVLSVATSYTTFCGSVWCRQLFGYWAVLMAGFL